MTEPNLDRPVAPTMKTGNLEELFPAETGQRPARRVNLPEITPREQEAFDCILKFKRENGGLSPTFREIMQGTTITSTSVVSYYLKKLREKGFIEMPQEHKNRSIHIIGESWQGAPDYFGSEALLTNGALVAIIQEAVNTLREYYPPRHKFSFHSRWISKNPEQLPAVIAEFLSTLGPPPEDGPEALFLSRPGQTTKK